MRGNFRYLAIIIGMCLPMLNNAANNTTSELTNSFECQIYNDYYKGEFLYAESDKLKMHPFIRNVNTWKMGANAGKSEASLTFNANDEKAIWQLIQVKHARNASTFFIRNRKFDEYMFASDDGSNILRRKVYTKWSPVTSLLLQCHNQPAHSKCKKHTPKDKAKMWIISPNTYGHSEKDAQKEKAGSFRKVTIYNAAFAEAMYAPGFFSGNSYMFSRQVHTWYKAPDSAQFNWILKCKEENYPTLV